MTDRVFGAPPRYIQSAGALAQLAPLIGQYGRRPFIIADAASGDARREEIEQQLKPSTDRVVFGLAGTSCTEAEIERFAETARMLDADVLAGFGGGAAIGIAKGIRLATGLPLLTIPTVPCCHAPVSRFVEIGGDDGRVGAMRAMPLPPDVVLVDTAVIAAAPPRVFIAGIGDALVRHFEVEHNAGAGAMSLLGGRPTLLAAAAGEAAWRAIRKHAVAALAMRTRRSGGEALERVTEAMVLLSGIAHESGGPSIAHALARGFASLPACRTALHGELVALALLAQLVFDARPAELLAEVVALYRGLGLPVRLAEIGIVGDRAAAVETAARRGVPLDAKRLAQAILEADALTAK
ncbi:MAG: iron-containing alcohol dehydrogenase [Stellaceae bacterium]